MMAPTTAARVATTLSFDVAAHITHAPDGRVVPSVTTVLGACGIDTDFIALADIAPRVRTNIEIARARGSAVHADCHAYDDDDLDWATVDPRVRPYVAAWSTARANLGLVPVVHARERMVYHDVYDYTGITDGIFEVPARSIRVLVEEKTGDHDEITTGLQTSAYEAAWVRMHPDLPIDERWAIQLCPNLRVPYRVVNYSARQDAWRDFSLFTCCLSVYRIQRQQRSKR